MANRLVKWGRWFRLEKWRKPQLMQQLPYAHQIVFLHCFGQIGNDGEGTSWIKLRRMSGQYDANSIFIEQLFEVLFLPMATNALHETLQ